MVKVRRRPRSGAVPGAAAEAWVSAPRHERHLPRLRVACSELRSGAVGLDDTVCPTPLPRGAPAPSATAPTPGLTERQAVLVPRQVHCI